MSTEFASKKILVLYCGGGDFNKDLKENELDKWLDDFLELQILAQVAGEFIYSGPGSEISMDYWTKLAEIISEKYKDYDGFVVTHGVDNVLYSANMLSCMLQGLGKPVIFTGSAKAVHVEGVKEKGLENIFKKYSPLGLNNNLVNAVQAGTMSVPGVSLLYDGHLIKADKAEFNLTSDTIFKGESLGDVNFGFNLKAEKELVNTNFNLVKDFEKKIKIIDLDLVNKPDLDFTGYKGVVVRGYLEDKELKLDTDLPILVLGQGNYEERDNLIVLKDYTYEAGVCKFMWALGQTTDLDRLKQLMKQSLC